MYKRNRQGWLKHIDFILMDLLVLQISYVLGYMIRFGWGEWPYSMMVYKSLGIILAAVDFLVIVFFNTLHNVMRRGYLVELGETLKQSALIMAIMTLYIFSVQAGEAYSRITLYLTIGIHFFLGYLARILWKPVVRRINWEKNKDTMILVADENSVAKILAKADTLDDFQ